MDARHCAAPLIVAIGLSLSAAGCGLPSFHRFSDPLSPEEHVNLGVAYESRGEYELALKEYTKAAEELAIADLYIGNVCWQLGDEAGARSAWERAADEADSPQALNNLAWSFYSADENLEEGRRLAARAVRLEPNVEDYWDTLSRIEDRLAAPRAGAGK